MAMVNLNLETALRTRPPPPWPAPGHDRPSPTARRLSAPFVLPAPLPWYVTIDPILLLGVLAAIGTGVLLLLAAFL